MFRKMEKLFWRAFGSRVSLILELDGRMEGMKRDLLKRIYVKWAKKKRKKRNKKTLRLSYRILSARVFMMLYYMGFSFLCF